MAYATTIAVARTATSVDAKASQCKIDDIQHWS